MAGFPRPFEGKYAISLTVAILALAPYIVVTTAYFLYRDEAARELGVGRQGLEILSGLATAGYAFGALLGGDLTQRFPQRPLFLVCQFLFSAGCIMAAAAHNPILFGCGRVLFGFATGLLLVCALPPVVRRYPARHMPVTAAVVNIGFFGAVAGGPVIGGLIADYDAWRWFYGALAAVGAANFILALLTLPDQEAPHPDLRFDREAVLLAFAATFLPFGGAGALSGTGFASFAFAVPVFVGLVCYVALLLTEYHKKEPLAPVKLMWSSLPVIGTWAAMIGGGVFVSFMMLAVEFLIHLQHLSPFAAGVSFWPQIIGTLITAALLGALFRTRYLPLLLLGGMLALSVGGALLLTLEPGSGAVRFSSAVFLLGLGAGATVSPGLFIAGFALSSEMLGRIFSLVELVRTVPDFVLAPVILEVAMAASGGKKLTLAGFRLALWSNLGLAIAATIFGAALYFGGGLRLPRPDLVNWIEKGGRAMDSPPLLAILRRTPKPAE